MKAFDQGSSLFWLSISVYAFVESVKMGVGTVQNPGMGFMSFVVSGTMGVLSAILFVSATLRKGLRATRSVFAGSLWHRVVLVLAVLVVYAKAMPWAGYLISTFLLMTALFAIVRGQKWWAVLLASFLTTVVTYYVFSVWLRCDFPKGFLAF